MIVRALWLVRHGMPRRGQPAVSSGGGLPLASHPPFAN
jgi:hypothetical protein